MKTIADVEMRRGAVLAKMRNIRSMKCGPVSEQYLQVIHKGKPDPDTNGGCPRRDL